MHKHHPPQNPTTEIRNKYHGKYDKEILEKIRNSIHESDPVAAHAVFNLTKQDEQVLREFQGSLDALDPAEALALSNITKQDEQALNIELLKETVRRGEFPFSYLAMTELRDQGIDMSDELKNASKVSA